MTTTITPYEEFHAGDLIEAERMNTMQVKIKQDIAGQVGQVNDALNEHMEAPVDADTFGGKTPDEWKGDLDQRYVMRSEIPSNWGEYRRYFKQLDRQLGGAPTFGPAIIEHELDRYPVITVFELLPLDVSDEANTGVKFLVYYAGHRDNAASRLSTRGLDTVHWGDSLDLLLDQFGLQVTPKQLFDDVLNDLWGRMFDPGLDQDHFRREAYGHSDYVQQQILDKDRTVEELKQMGIWEDLHMALRPRMIPLGIPYGDRNQDGATKQVDVFYLSQDALEIQATQQVDLMVLLRT